MELTVYRQSIRTRIDGTVVYKGEDALPYIDDKLMIVADGLGGSAAIRHQKIVKDMFDEDKILDVLFKGVYGDYSDPVFSEYVKKSFFELFAVRHCYFDNPNNIKKSGYFASRIVSAIILHEIIYNKDSYSKDLFYNINNLDSDEKKEKACQIIGDHFSELVKDNLRKIAKNANLIYESILTGLSLLGTTLCATVYYETDSCVDAIYLTAGDSRPYVWNPENGLMQVLDDQERADGGMTNCIQANEDTSFGIRCNYFRFSKPCILFNASDGCFDSRYFLSQMAFEKLILEKGMESEDAANMGKGLYDVFLEYGKHDDSSTIAMKFFGFESFGAFRESAARRMETLNSEYLSRMPDLLDHDYAAENEQIAANFSERLYELKSDFEKEIAIRDFCVEQIKSGKYLPYTEKMKAIDEQIAETKAQKREPEECIEDIVARNYIRFLAIQNNGSDVEKTRAVSKINAIDEIRRKKSEDFVSMIDGYRRDFEETTERLKYIIEQIFEIGIPADYSDYDDVCIAVVEECERSMAALFEFFHSVKKKKQGAISKLTQLRNEYISQNLRLAYGNKENLHRICDMVISGEIAPDAVDAVILKDDSEKLKRALAKIHDVQQRIDFLEKDEKKKVFQECRDAFWNENYFTIVEEALGVPDMTISDELREKARKTFEESKSATNEIKINAELQASLFAKYNIGYSQYINKTVG